MKKLLAKFRLSNALDEKPGEPIPDSLGEKINASPELRDFAQRTSVLDRALRRPPAAPVADPALHHSIMRAVRDSISAEEPAPRRMPMGIGVATAFAFVAVIGLWLAARPPAHRLATGQSEEQNLAVARNLMEIGGEISRSVPPAMVAPLSNEWACVDHDVRDTTQFILASLP